MDYPDLTETDLPAPAMETAFLVHADASDDFIHRLVRVLLRHRKHLDRIHASLAAFDPTCSLATCPVPPQSGARSAYAEAGFTFRDGPAPASCPSSA